MHPERIEQLELKLAYLERANQDLSDVVYAQQQQLDALQRRLQTALERMTEASQPERPWTPAEEVPPHY